MLLRPRWRKVLRDLWLYKLRTILVVASIAVGVMVVGMISTSRMILEHDLRENYRQINPASAMLLVSYYMLGQTEEGFDDDLVTVVERMRDVAEAEGRRSTSVRLNVGPDEWRDLQLFAIPDYDDIRINQVHPESGAWPPPDKTMLIERAALGLTNASVGDQVVIKMPNGTTRTITISGLAHDLSQMPSFLDGTIYGYVTFDTLEWLGEPRNYNQMYIVVEGDRYNREYVQRVTTAVRDKIERSGRTVLITMVPEPDTHPLNDVIQTIVLLLGVIGFFSLLLSGFLVINTISGLLRQQMHIIGVMKAIGTRASQMIQLYIGMVLIFGVLSLTIAVPLGALGAWQFTRFMAGMFNFNVTDFRLPLQVIALQAAVSLLVPFLAAIVPIMIGTRITAREAISDFGQGYSTARRVPARTNAWSIAALWAWLGVTRPFLLSLRNTFRRKTRLALTLLTLSLGGAIFIGVFSVHDSLSSTVDELMQTWDYDLMITLDRSHRLDHIEAEALRVPGVVAARGAGMTITRRVRADETESDMIMLMAPPVAADLVRPVIVQGRWLLPQDERAIVVSTYLLMTEPDIQVGDDLVLKLDGRDTTWRVVGTCQYIGAVAFVNYPYYADVMHETGRASSVWVVTEQHDLPAQTSVAQRFERQFERAGLRVTSIAKFAEERAEINATFQIITTLLLFMAVLLAIVGGLGLTGTMSLNVLERTREVGVMRAIGASNWAILQIVIGEGVLIGFLSWLFGAAVSLPISKLLSDAVGMAFWQSPLTFTFSVSGMLIWLLVVLLLSAVASFLPAWNASRLTVREVLAYE